MTLTAAPTWKAAHASVIGRSHAQAGTPCQDAAAVSRGDGALAVCVCDGAGSAALSHLGSRALADAMAVHLREHIDGLATGSVTQESLVDAAAQVVAGLVVVSGGSPLDYASTLVGVAVNGRHAVIVHLGDGLVVRVTAGVPEVVSAPENGEFANETFFVTCPGAAMHLRLRVLELGPLDTSFVLMTDGAQGRLFNRQENTASQVTEQLASWLDDHTEEDVCGALAQFINDVIVPATFDDCTIAVLRRDARVARFACPGCRRWEFQRKAKALVCAACGAPVVELLSEWGRYTAHAGEFVHHLVGERGWSLHKIERATAIRRRTLRRWIRSSTSNPFLERSVNNE